MAATTPAREIQDEFLSTLRKGQETVIEAIKTWVETVHSVTPKLPAVHMPFAEHMPTPEDVVSNAYDFAEALLANQRKFAEDVLKATSALLPPDGKPAPKAAAK